MDPKFSYVASFAMLAVCGCSTLDTPSATAKTPDAAVDEFLRDYIGVQFGDDISKINGFEDAQYMVSMKKKFQYFDKACVYYRKGKLYRVNFGADIGKEYSQNSTEAQIRKSVSAIEPVFNLPPNYFARHSRGDFRLWGKAHASSEPMSNLTYSITFASMDWPNFRRYSFDLVDTKLDQETKSNKLATPQYKPVTPEMRKSWGLPLPDAN